MEAERRRNEEEELKNLEAEYKRLLEEEDYFYTDDESSSDFDESSSDFESSSDVGGDYDSLLDLLADLQEEEKEKQEEPGFWSNFLSGLFVMLLLSVIGYLVRRFITKNEMVNNILQLCTLSLASINLFGYT